MPQVTIENPILNSPHAEPGRHFKFNEEGITDEVVDSRRIAVDDDGGIRDDLLNLILECAGDREKEKSVKVGTARNFWVTAVNHDGSFGRWEFLVISDPWDAANRVRNILTSNVSL
jgi:hypothetical protein